MSRLSAFTAVAILTALAATPVSAQEVIRNPGAFAFSHPYLDVLSGAPTPALRLSSDPAAMQAYAARESGIGRPTASTAANQRYLYLSSHRQTLAWSHPSGKYRHSR
jgi:hypothetical protein